MAKTALGMSRRTLVQALSGSAALFGITGVLAPRALEAAYGLPSSPHTRQLLRVLHQKGGGSSANSSSSISDGVLGTGGPRAG